MPGLGWMFTGDWLPALWFATAASVLLAAYMRIQAPAFTALQAHSFFGYHVRRVKKMLKVLHGDRERLARVNRVRKLDQFLPVLTGVTLIGWSLYFSGILGAAHLVPRLTLILGIAASLIAVGFDYLENARIGATFSYPLNQRQSLKVVWAKGVTTRIGGNLNTVVVGWQYAWF